MMMVVTVMSMMAVATMSMTCFGSRDPGDGQGDECCHTQ
jgi:hypothetical protein